MSPQLCRRCYFRGSASSCIPSIFQVSLWRFKRTGQKGNLYIHGIPGLPHWNGWARPRSRIQYDPIIRWSAPLLLLGCFRPGPSMWWWTHPCSYGLWISLLSLRWHDHMGVIITCSKFLGPYVMCTPQKSSDWTPLTILGMESQV